MFLQIHLVLEKISEETKLFKTQILLLYIFPERKYVSLHLFITQCIENYFLQNEYIITEVITYRHAAPCFL